MKNTTKKPYQNNPKQPHHYITKKIRYGVYKQTLDHGRSSLPGKDKIFSKIVHSKTLDLAGEIGAKTIAKPKAVLGGSISMVFGGLTIIVIAKHVGFEVPFSVLIILYVLGFISSLVLEFFYKIAKRSRR